MSTSELPVSSSSSWASIVSRTSQEVMSKIQQERPELLEDIFLEPIKLLPISSSCRELIDVWFQVSPAIPHSIKLRSNMLQSEDSRRGVAKACQKDVKDITRECVDSGGVFVCLKVEKLSRLPKPVPDKTLIIIALGPLHSANGLFRGVHLAQGESTIISGDEPQVFDGGKKGGGFGIVLRVKHKSFHYSLLPKVLDDGRRT